MAQQIIAEQQRLVDDNTELPAICLESNNSDERSNHANELMMNKT